MYEENYIAFSRESVKRCNRFSKAYYKKFRQTRTQQVFSMNFLFSIPNHPTL